MCADNWSTGVQRDRQPDRGNCARSRSSLPTVVSALVTLVEPSGGSFVAWSYKYHFSIDFLATANAPGPRAFPAVSLTTGKAFRGTLAPSAPGPARQMTLQNQILLAPNRKFCVIWQDRTVCSMSGFLCYFETEREAREFLSRCDAENQLADLATLASDDLQPYTITAALITRPG